MASLLLPATSGGRLCGSRRAAAQGSAAKPRRGYRASLRTVRASSSEEQQPPAAAAPAQRDPAPAAPTSAPAPEPRGAGGLLAGGAAGVGVALFLAARLATGGPSFAALEAEATPLDVALSNGKPTVLEFYADYCEVGAGAAAWAACTSSATRQRPWAPECMRASLQPRSRLGCPRFAAHPAACAGVPRAAAADVRGRAGVQGARQLCDAQH